MLGHSKEVVSVRVRSSLIAGLITMSLSLTNAMFASLASADEAFVQLKIGDEAPSWSDLPGTDDGKHSLADLQEKRVVVVCFTSNSCPYSVDYEDRMIEFHKKFSDRKEGVALIAINSNHKPAEQLDRMKERARIKEFPFLYLIDETQKVAASYGANFTPEFFVLNEDRRIVYIGAMDDGCTESRTAFRGIGSRGCVEKRTAGDYDESGARLLDSV
jgi:peroxiredoxin